MHCTRCKQKIPDQLDCCPDCQIVAQIECQQCHAGMPQEAVFCAQCGSKLGKPSDHNIADDLQLPTQRRHLTVVFCDLVGSTGLSIVLDPEDLSELLVQYRDLCMGIIKKWGGYLADYQGDGVMIYFGYPTAHEDDSLRAVYAALDIIEAIAENDFQLDVPQLAVRIGINSGRAVIGNIGTGEVAQNMGIVGETPNVAAKIQTRAENNEVIISESTYRNVQGFFNFEKLTAQQIKGVEKTINVYKVINALEQAERFEGKRYVGLNRITGRDKEFQILTNNWKQCQNGKSYSTAIIGEAGIGKSRLLWSFRQWLKPFNHSTIVFNCSAYHTQTALYPFVELISRGADKDKSKSNKRLRVLFDKLNCFEAESFESNLEVLIDFIYERKIKGDPEKYKNQIYDIFISMARSMSQQAPLLIIVEDLHWIDPTTLDFLIGFLESSGLENIYLVITTRHSPDKALKINEKLTLDPLDDSQSKKLVKQIFNEKQIPDFLLNQLIDSCNGNPLYLEESARYLLETKILDQQHSKQQLHLISKSISFTPESLQDLFMSRLDRLSTEKWIAQLACALGRQFDKRILKDVAQIDADLLNKTLMRLTQADIVYPVDDQSQNTYEFKHVLLRDATYDALLRSQRQFIHQKIIDVYNKQQPDLIDRQPELVAYHYTQACDNDNAVKAWQIAGKKAQRLSANIEAVSHFRKALELLEEQSDTHIKLDLLIQMGPSLMAIESWASDEVKSLYKQCIDLSEISNNDTQLFTSLRGLWGNVFLRGDLKSAKAITKQLSTIANRHKTNELIIEAQLSQAMEKFWLGEFVQSQKQLDQVNKLYDQNKHREHAYTFSVDPGVVSLFYASRNSWYLGFPDQALENVKASIFLAQQQQHYPSLTWGLGFYAAVHVARAEYDLALEISRQGIELSTQHDFPLWGAWGQVLNGYVKVIVSHSQDGLDQIEQGIGVYKSLGAGVALPYFYTLLGQSLLYLDQPVDALEITDKAIKFACKHAINSSLPDLFLLKSTALQKMANVNTCEILSITDQAYEIAQSQQAKISILKIILKRLELMDESDSKLLEELHRVYQQFNEGWQIEELRSARKILISEKILDS